MVQIHGEPENLKKWGPKNLWNGSLSRNLVNLPRIFIELIYFGFTSFLIGPNFLKTFSGLVCNALQYWKCRSTP